MFVLKWNTDSGYYHAVCSNRDDAFEVYWALKNLYEKQQPINAIRFDCFLDGVRFDLSTQRGIDDSIVLNSGRIDDEP